MLANVVNFKIGRIKSGSLAGQQANVMIIDGAVNDRDDFGRIFQSMSLQAFSSNAPLLIQGLFMSESDVKRLVEQARQTGACCVAIYNTREDEGRFVVWNFRKDVRPTTDVIEDVEILDVV